jgi:ATP-dependent DNA helicase RecG
MECTEKTDDALEPPAKELRFIRGVGPHRAGLLAGMGLRTVADFLLTAPRRHEDRRQLTPPGRLTAGQRATTSGRILAIGQRTMKGVRHILTVEVGDGAGWMEAVWFNQPYLVDRFRQGADIILTGKVDEFRGIKRMNTPEFEIIEPAGEEETGADTPYSEIAFGRLTPVYALTEGLGQRFMRRLAWRTVMEYADGWPEVFPAGFRTERDLLDIGAALRGLHFPDNEHHRVAAHRRLAYEELLMLQLILARRRAELTAGGASKIIRVTPALDKRIRARLGFRLTPGQERTVAEIVRDLARPRPMNRLLQGEVGSGKTAVAAFACLAAVAHGSQAAIMAPTEVLAEQHGRTFSSLLAGSRVRIVTLSASVGAAQRRTLTAAVAAGEADLVIATHALIRDEVRFRELSLVVLDEQHKFGVEQRRSLAGKGPAPHVLVMSATPIPRTLAQAYYADLDVSVIREVPGGERAVVTRVVTERSRGKVLSFLERRLQRGGRGYVVYPAIAETGDGGIAAAETGHRELCARFGPQRVELLHGRMRPEARHRAMERFRSGQVQLLVATTVIEVGVDVPEATVMIIEGAERFGLATLHQLRGRVGRGAQKKSWCICVAHAHAPEAIERLRVFAKTRDAFRLAEEDLRLRGPGEFLGERQHGLPELRFADLLADGELLELARRDALRIITDDPRLERAEHTGLRDRLRRLAAARGNLAGVA